MRVAPLAILLLLAGTTACASAGSVRMRDGRTLEGDARLTARMTIAIAVTPGAAPVEVPLDQVEHADLRRAPATRPATPAKWETREINSSGGSVDHAGTRIVTHDNGRGLRGGSEKGRGGDSFLFVHQPLDGDAEVIARVYSDAGGRVGLMVRESLDADAPFAMVARGGGRDDTTTLLARTAPAAEQSIAATSDVPILGAAWVKLLRTGHAFAAFESPDGKRWTPIGEARVGMLGEKPVHVGLAAAAGGRAVFDAVAVRRVAPGSDDRSPRGLLLRTGSFIAGDVVGGDDTTFVLTHQGRRVTVPTTDVARAVLRPLTPDLLAKLQAATPPGALLASGDFVEGSFKSLDGQSLKLNSVIFGLKSFNRQGQAAAISIVAGATPQTGLVFTREDGSTFLVDQATLDVDHPILGRVSLAPEHVVFIRRPGARD